MSADKPLTGKVPRERIGMLQLPPLPASAAVQRARSLTWFSPQLMTYRRPTPAGRSDTEAQPDSSSASRSSYFMVIPR